MSQSYSKEHEQESQGRQPHPRNGHVRVPNEILERLAQLEASGSQYRIIFAVWRRTLGWQRSGEWKNESYPISLGDLAKATGVNRRHIAREVRDLVHRNILERMPGEAKNLLRFNLDYTSWIVSKRSIDNGKMATGTDGDMTTNMVAKRSLALATKSGVVNNTKETRKKQKETETLRNKFERGERVGTKAKQGRRRPINYIQGAAESGPEDIENMPSMWRRI